MNFSIIIPAKNEEKNIGRCLESILAVEWDKGDYEILLVDNGSTDSTVSIAQKCGVRVFCRPGDTISALRNFGASQAKGRILVFLDADCSVESDWLKEASRYLSYEKVVCYGSPPVVPHDATWVQKAWFHVRKKREVVQKVDWLESMNMFVRRDAFIACDGFDENLVTCEDYDLSLRLKKIGALISDSRIVAVHHGEAATVAHFFRKEMWRGLSNFKGSFRHGLIWSEIPSLVAPTVHCFLIILAVLSLLFLQSRLGQFALMVFLSWQVLLLAVSFRKTGQLSAIQPGLQLFWLMNVYFTARGLSVLRWKAS